MKFCYECGVKVVRKMKKVGSRKRNAGGGMN
jgi:rRNA maturation endonuclease Nob1